jgi:hypothetical protein
MGEGFLCFAHNAILPRCRPTPLLADERSIPDLHCGYITVITEDAQGAGIEQEMLPGARRDADPAGCEHA